MIRLFVSQIFIYIIYIIKVCICIYFYVPSGHFIAHFVARKCIAHWNKNVQQMIYKIAAKIPRVS